tara:strand:+ start:81 stop:479 length:399 start_codon:yes stop_codon:yes gene_type:complete
MFKCSSTKEYERALRSALSEIKTELKMEKEHNLELVRTMNRLKLHIEDNKQHIDKCNVTYKMQLEDLKKRTATLKDCLAAALAAYEAKDAEFKKETEKYNAQLIEANELIDRIQKEVLILRAQNKTRRWFFF